MSTFSENFPSKVCAMSPLTATTPLLRVLKLLDFTGSHAKRTVQMQPDKWWPNCRFYRCQPDTGLCLWPQSYRSLKQSVFKHDTCLACKRTTSTCLLFSGGVCLKIELMDLSLHPPNRISLFKSSHQWLIDVTACTLPLSLSLSFCSSVSLSPSPHSPEVTYTVDWASETSSFSLSLSPHTLSLSQSQCAVSYTHLRAHETEE